MILTLKSLTEQFNIFLENDEKYQEALRIVKKNSRGRIWLVGGYVLKNLIGYSLPIKDLDFIVEESNNQIVLDDSWVLGRTSFHNPRFLKKDMQIDFMPLQEMSSLIFHGLDRTILNYLKRAPFNINSIVYDINHKKLIGRIGRDAINSRVVEVNDLEMARSYAKKYNLTINEFLQKKADEIGFEAKLLSST